MMGTPHSKQAEDEIWRNLSLIPKASLKKFSKLDISDDEMEILIRISRQFEKINDTPIAPILSAYEKRETRVRRGLGGFQVKSTLVSLLPNTRKALLMKQSIASEKRILSDSYST